MVSCSRITREGWGGGGLGSSCNCNGTEIVSFVPLFSYSKGHIIMVMVDLNEWLIML